MLISVLLLNIAYAAIVQVDWSVGWVSNVNPDGLYPRRAIGVNGVWPIPAINAFIGDTLVINLANALDQPTILHTHGIFQNGTNFMDGVPGVTSCAVPPGQSFVYTFTLQQSGTYWIHGHLLGAYVDGLRAPVIIHEVNEAASLNYDSEYVITMSDWYHQEHAPLLDHFLSIFNPRGTEPIPNSAILNDAPNQVFQLVPGMTYRFRLIAVSALSMFNVWFDGHNMTVIEADGVLVEPFMVSSLKIASAQRYSVLITALNVTTTNYNFNAEFDTSMFDSVPHTLNPRVSALLRYSPTAPLAPVQLTPDTSSFDDTALVPRVAMPPVKSDVIVVLNADFQLYTDGVNHGTFNEISYKRPNVPTIFSALTMGDNAANPAVYGKVTNPLVLSHLEMVYIVINNLDSGKHPCIFI